MVGVVVSTAVSLISNTFTDFFSSLTNFHFRPIRPSFLCIVYFGYSTLLFLYLFRLFRTEWKMSFRFVLFVYNWLIVCVCELKIRRKRSRRKQEVKMLKTTVWKTPKNQKKLKTRIGAIFNAQNWHQMNKKPNFSEKSEQIKWFSVNRACNWTRRENWKEKQTHSWTENDRNHGQLTDKCTVKLWTSFIYNSCWQPSKKRFFCDVCSFVSISFLFYFSAVQTNGNGEGDEENLMAKNEQNEKVEA